MNKTQLVAVEITLNKFSKNQIVQFIGSVGLIENFRPGSGTWTYTVEMEMGALARRDQNRFWNHNSLLWIKYSASD